MSAPLPDIAPPAPRPEEPGEKDYFPIMKRIDKATKKVDRLGKQMPGFSSINSKLNKEIQQFMQGVGK